MVPILTAIFILLLSINFVLGFDKTIILAQGFVSSSSQIPNNNLTTDQKNDQALSVLAKIPVTQGILPPVLSAQSVMVRDLDSQTILYAKNENKTVPIASTTKIMTALVAASYFGGNDTLEVKDLSGVSGASMGLKLTEKLTFRSLLYGMLLNSGNDAAFVIAQNYPGGTLGFVVAMNQKASELGLENSHFTNPAGFDHPNHYSSALDMDKIAQAAIEDPQLLKVVGTKQTVVASTDRSTIHNLKNLNQLLDTPGVIGIKTGYTPAAKENLVGLVERDDHRILTVVLNSDDRFGETEKLIDWVYSNFIWK